MSWQGPCSFWSIFNMFQIFFWVVSQHSFLHVFCVLFPMYRDVPAATQHIYNIYIWGRDLWGLFRSYLRMLANLIICSHHVLSHFLPCYQSLQRRPLKSKAQWLVFNSQRGDNSQEPPQVHGDPGAQKGKDGERPHRQRWGAGIEKGMSRNMVNTLLKGEHLKPLVQRGCTHAAPLATPCDKNGTSCPKRRLNSLAKGMEPLGQRWDLLLQALFKEAAPCQKNGTYCPKRRQQFLGQRNGTSCSNPPTE